MKSVLSYFAKGILVAVGGIVFSAFFASWFNGIEVGSACAVGIGVYLCVVVVTCTGVIVSKSEAAKNKDASEK